MERKAPRSPARVTRWQSLKYTVHGAGVGIHQEAIKVCVPGPLTFMGHYQNPETDAVSLSHFSQEPLSA